MRTVVVTGGIGSGKSFVCRYLSSRGVSVYDSDAMTKSLYDRRPLLVDDIENKFGCSLKGPDGRLDRKRLASIVFSDRSRLQQLEALVHPYVREDFLQWRDVQLKKKWEGYTPEPFVVLESAIILQNPLFSSLYDKVVLVDAPEHVRLERACLRDGVPAEAVRQRMSSQVLPDGKEVDAVILNDADEESLFAKVDEVFAGLWA